MKIEGIAIGSLDQWNHEIGYVAFHWNDWNDLGPTAQQANFAYYWQNVKKPFRQNCREALYELKAGAPVIDWAKSVVWCNGAQDQLSAVVDQLHLELSSSSSSSHVTNHKTSGTEESIEYNKKTCRVHSRNHPCCRPKTKTHFQEMTKNTLFFQMAMFT
jgi:hypothetical protein